VNAVFEATVQATEEAIVNAMIAAHTSTGADGYTMYGLPHRELQDMLKRYGRLEAPGK
jgi:L-aminopeptidase/D-esterase-like protein